MRILALLSVRTEPCQIERTKHTADMFLRAVGSEGTKPFGVVRTGREFGVWVDVKVETFICGMRVSIMEIIMKVME